MMRCRLRGLHRVLALATTVALGVVCLLFNNPAQAGKNPGGHFQEFALNNPNSLHGSFGDPLMARLRAGGRFVIVTSVIAATSGLSGTYFQIYNAQGTPLGDLTRTTAPIRYAIWASGVAAAGNGFVLVWEAAAEIRGQRYSGSGAKLGPEFKINTTPDGSKWTNSIPTVAGLVDGGFVVVWQSFYHYDFYPGGPPRMIFAQRYDAQGREIGGNFLVRDHVEGPFSVTGLADGGFAIAYTADSFEQRTAVVQRYTADGEKAGEGFTASGPYDAANPTIVSLNSGGFVVAWNHISKREIYARRFSAAGLPNGPAFSASAQSVYYGKASVSVLDDDRLLFAYNTGDAIYARLHGATADPAGDIPAFRVSATPALPGTAYLAPVTVSLSGRNVFVAWAILTSAGGLEVDRQIRLRRLDFPPPAP